MHNFFWFFFFFFLNAFVEEVGSLRAWQPHHRWIIAQKRIQENLPYIRFCGPSGQILNSSKVPFSQPLTKKSKVNKARQFHLGNVLSTRKLVQMTGWIFTAIVTNRINLIVAELTRLVDSWLKKKWSSSWCKRLMMFLSSIAGFDDYFE